MGGAVAGVLALIGVLELLWGLITFWTGSTIMQQIVGTLAFGFGLLTMAVVSGAEETRRAVNRLRTEIEDARKAATDAPQSARAAPRGAQPGTDYVNPKYAPGDPEPIEVSGRVPESFTRTSYAREE
jgi:hypothetical protein